jgi:hypothetical protein
VAPLRRLGLSSVCADEQLEAALVPAGGERNRRAGGGWIPSGLGHGFVTAFGVLVNIWLSFRGSIGSS